MANYLVTGAGFIGRHLVEKLLSSNQKVFTTGLEEPVPGTIHLDSYFQNIKWGELPRIDTIFHQAAITTTLNPNKQYTLQVNYEDSRRLLQNAIEHNCKKFVYASSSAVYGNSPTPFKENGMTAPLNVYGMSKLMFDNYAMNYAEQTNCSIIGLRYTNVYGIGEEHKGMAASMISQIYKQMSNGEQPTLFKYGEHLRDWIHVSDVVKANLAVMRFKGSGIFNIGSGIAVSFNLIVELLNDLLETNLRPSYVENNIENQYQTYTLSNIQKAKEELRWSPEISLIKGLRNLVKKQLTKV